MPHREMKRRQGSSDGFLARGRGLVTASIKANPKASRGLATARKKTGRLPDRLLRKI